MLWILYWTGIVIAVIIAFIHVYSFFNVMYYSKKGVRFMWFNALGDTCRILYHTYLNPYKIAFNPMFEHYWGSREKMPDVTGVNTMGFCFLSFNTVDSLNDLWVTKNSKITKHELERQFGEPLLKTNILNMDSQDPTYRGKRKVLSSAFFKSKVQQMTMTVKETALRVFKDIQAKGEKSEEDLVKVTTKVQNHIITNILLGKGRSFETIPFVNVDGTTKDLELGDFIDAMIESLFERFSANILVMVFPSLLQYQITAVDRAFFKNCDTLRTKIGQIIADKAEQIKRGELEVNADTDMISLILVDEMYQKEREQAIDDVIVMFIAGTKTVQGTTTNFIGNYMNNKELREKFHTEVDPLMEKVGDDVLNKYTFEMTDSLEYTKMAYNEVMRLDTPFDLSSTNTVTEPCNMAGIDVVPGDAMMINMGAIHKDPKQWIEPYSFIPERFDPNSKYYLRPDGGKRNPLAFTPFLGGHRICLGKTFAEITLKYTLPMYTYFFDFAWKDEEHYKERPVYQFGAFKIREMPVIMTTKNKVNYTPAI